MKDHKKYENIVKDTNMKLEILENSQDDISGIVKGAIAFKEGRGIINQQKRESN